MHLDTPLLAAAAAARSLRYALDIFFLTRTLVRDRPVVVCGSRSDSVTGDLPTDRLNRTDRSGATEPTLGDHNVKRGVFWV